MTVVTLLSGAAVTQLCRRLSAASPPADGSDGPDTRRAAGRNVWGTSGPSPGVEWLSVTPGIVSQTIRALGLFVGYRLFGTSTATFQSKRTLRGRACVWVKPRAGPLAGKVPRCVGVRPAAVTDSSEACADGAVCVQAEVWHRSRSTGLVSAPSRSPGPVSLARHGCELGRVGPSGSGAASVGNLSVVSPLPAAPGPRPRRAQSRQT